MVDNLIKGRSFFPKGSLTEASNNFPEFCNNVGVDYHQLAQGLKGGKNDLEIAQELGVMEDTIKELRERVEALDIRL